MEKSKKREIMDIEEMKRNWQQMELRMDKIEEENQKLIARLKKNKAMGAKQRLMVSYFRMAIICIVSPVWIFLLEQEAYVGKILEIYYVLFFVALSAVNFYIWYFMKLNDYKTMSVKDALIKSYEIELLCKRGKLVGYILGLPLIVLLMCALYKAGIIEAFTGGCVGLIIGGAIGSIVNLKNKKMLREMRLALEEELAETDDDNC